MAHLHVLPARAGMSPRSVSVPKVKIRAPRTGGDEPYSLLLLLNQALCSPHGRG